jgi:Ca2+:H+ antiporter
VEQDMSEKSGSPVPTVGSSDTGIWKPISGAWPWLTPTVSSAVLALATIVGLGPLLAILCGAGVIGAVIAAVHHAEVIAHRIGEPFGTLVLAVAVTVIEASLILSMMVAGREQMATLPRDTIYAAVMIICNGVVGLCLLVGGLAHREQSFRVEGSGSGFAALIVMSALTLALPVFTVVEPGMYTGPQLSFVAITSIALWAIFVFVQTIRHRDYFIPARGRVDPEAHAERPTLRDAWISFGLLLLSLVAVVGLAKKLSPLIEQAIDAVGAPRAVVGIVVATLVLLPETAAAVRAAQADRLQASLNLAIGSALACIGLTIPVVVATTFLFNLPLVLGLGSKDLAMLVLTFIVSTVTLGTGRTNMMQGAVHLVIFAAFLFLAFAP